MSVKERRRRVATDRTPPHEAQHRLVVELRALQLRLRLFAPMLLRFGVGRALRCLLLFLQRALRPLLVTA
eukprot:3571568-Rhodomonas_salina.3